MNGTLLKTGLLCLAVSIFGVISAMAEEKKEADDYTRTVVRPYEQVLAAVKEAAQTQGFRVSNVRDIAASLHVYFH